MNEEIKTMGMRVGKILSINGRVWLTRKSASCGDVGNFQVYCNMPVFLNDRFRAEKNADICIEFIIGGQAAIYHGYEWVVVGQRDISFVGGSIDAAIMMAGKTWAKVDKQKSQLQIKTSGGVLGGMNG